MTYVDYIDNIGIALAVIGFIVFSWPVTNWMARKIAASEGRETLNWSDLLAGAGVAIVGACAFPIVFFTMLIAAIPLAAISVSHRLHTGYWIPRMMRRSRSEDDVPR